MVWKDMRYSDTDSPVNSTGLVDLYLCMYYIQVHNTDYKNDGDDVRDNVGCPFIKYNNILLMLLY